VRVRGSAGAGGVCQRRGDSMLRVWGAERGGAVPDWTTFHPSQISLCRFAARCHELDAAGIRYSVGVVGLREHFDAIEELRRVLCPEVYAWIMDAARIHSRRFNLPFYVVHAK
jgi:hypothetical protein